MDGSAVVLEIYIAVSILEVFRNSLNHYKGGGANKRLQPSGKWQKRVLYSAKKTTSFNVCWNNSHLLFHKGRWRELWFPRLYEHSIKNRGTTAIIHFITREEGKIYDWPNHRAERSLTTLKSQVTTGNGISPHTRDRKQQLSTFPKGKMIRPLIG